MDNEGVSYYNGEKITLPKQSWTQEEKLRLLDTHPLFTGRCPNCEMPFTKIVKRSHKYICPHCFWKDDYRSHSN